MQRIKIHLLNKKISFSFFFFSPNGRFTNAICQVGRSSSLASLSNGDLGKNLYPFWPHQSLPPASLGLSQMVLGRETTKYSQGLLTGRAAWKCDLCWIQIWESKSPLNFICYPKPSFSLRWRRDALDGGVGCPPPGEGRTWSTQDRGHRRALGSHTDQGSPEHDSPWEHFPEVLLCARATAAQVTKN